jgi:hypothetical protein
MKLNNTLRNQLTDQLRCQLRYNTHNARLQVDRQVNNQIISKLRPLSIIIVQQLEIPLLWKTGWWGNRI